MIIHIVLWRLKNDADKMQNALLIKEKLEDLRGKIPTLLNIDVGININAADNAADIALYSKFASRTDLEAYIVHPLHVEAGRFIRSVVAERRSVDYEC